MLQEIAVRTGQSIALREAASAATDFARASKSEATRRAYQTDAADFAAWCERHSLEPLPVTMSPFVLCTIAESSFHSASGTLNLAIASSKSLEKAAHSPSVILRSRCDSRIARPVYF